MTVSDTQPKPQRPRTGERPAPDDSPRSDNGPPPGSSPPIGGTAFGSAASQHGHDDASLSLEPMVGLEWSQAIELPLAAGDAASPADLRTAWVHRAPLGQVLALYRAAGRSDGPVPSPWWLRALASGELASREAGFRVEDRVHKLLSRRPGWEFVPWAGNGESGFWEFMPSEGTGEHRRMPTTIVNTSRHTGWIDMVAAHETVPPQPTPVEGPAGLRAHLGEIEAVH